MNTEQMADVVARAAVHAALADPARLLITDTLALGDVSPSDLADMLAMPSNLLAHHLHVLEQAGLLTRHRSEGPPPQLRATGTGRARFAHPPPGAQRAAGAVRMHRQLGPLASGGRAVAAGQ